jgi:hypothetical protein
MKKYYYIFWVEGLSLKSGEKVKTLTDTGVDYTTQMTESLRVKPNDLGSVEAYMKRHGITYTTHKTSYAPKGTILNLKRIAI